jgi:hypothetical protein
MKRRQYEVHIIYLNIESFFVGKKQFNLWRILKGL